MLRKIIEINEELCDGCEECITDCAEGALAMVNGKAKVVKEQYCDGFGDCVKACHTGALVVVEREAEEFDMDATREYLQETQGVGAVERLEQAHDRHMADVKQTVATGGNGGAAPMGGGCPGSQMRVLQPQSQAPAPQPTAGSMPAQVNPSELTQWPIQIHLVPPSAPFFQDRELIIMNTCGPLASADVHWRYLRGRGVVVGCPKLDNTGPYAEKLGQILQMNNIPKVTVVRMEVPCCGGLTAITEQAVQISGRTDIEMQEDILGVDGALRISRTVVEA
jgi:ferredoxin